MNLDSIVCAGQQPWLPTPRAGGADVWDGYDFPTCGSFRLDDRLVVFTMIITAGSKSLWAYVPVPVDEELYVEDARFSAVGDFEVFLSERFAGREAVLADADRLVIASMSDGVKIPVGRDGLLAEAARWFAAKVGLDLREPIVHAEAISDHDELLRTTQTALASTAI